MEVSLLGVTHVVELLVAALEGTHAHIHTYMYIYNIIYVIYNIIHRNIYIYRFNYIDLDI